MSDRRIVYSPDPEVAGKPHPSRYRSKRRPIVKRKTMNFNLRLLRINNKVQE